MKFGTSLPIDSVLGELRAALNRQTSAVLVAPPGAGKTTRVPLALMDESWLQGRKILVAIYQGEGGSLLCYTLLGSEADAPANAARFFDPDMKMNFYAFSRAGINAVLHREGDVICILASEMPMDDLLALVKAKARPS